MPEDFTPPIFAAERQEKIAAFVASRGKIRLDELAAVFEVSQPTLRKDLTVLEQQGLLKRTHGGALSTRAPGERDLMTRFGQNIEAKRAIAEKAMHIAGQTCIYTNENVIFEELG